MANSLSIKKLILVPAVITLAVTLLRLTGELLHWSPRFFNPEAGGGGALIGIAWLVPVFGFYFGWVLAADGHGPASALKAIGYPLLGFAVPLVAGFGAIKLAGLAPQGLGLFAVLVVASLVGAFIAFLGWSALARTLLAYGLAARIPVILVMLFAILGDWGTHYDVAGPGTPPMTPIVKWLMIGVTPQLSAWMWFTIAVGAFFGGIAGAIKGRGAGRVA